MKTKIYSIDYLMNEELTDEDLNALCNSNSLIISLIIAMYRFMGSKKPDNDIKEQIKKDTNWLTEHKWTEHKRYQFEKKVAKVYKNIYSYGDTIALQKAQWFTSIYGFNLYIRKYYK